jgi:hypothetical protein
MIRPRPRIMNASGVLRYGIVSRDRLDWVSLARQRELNDPFIRSHARQRVGIMNSPASCDGGYGQMYGEFPRHPQLRCQMTLPWK